MLETIIDSEIFIDFCKSQPARVPIGTERENNEWLSFWSFLKSGTNLRFIKNDIFDGQKEESRFLTALASGRGDAKIEFDTKFNWPYKNKLPKDTFPGSFFCLIQSNEDKKAQLKTLNGYLFGFADNYKKCWRDLSFIEKSKTLSVKKGVKDAPRLEKWADLTKYILPFSDVIIHDNYILNDSRFRDCNLLEILKVLDSSVQSEYNLLIVSYEDEKISPANIDEYYSYVTLAIKRLNLKAKLGIVLASRSIKQHDRGIIMNYLRIKSGNSFNYFDHFGGFRINGTEIDFLPFCYKDYFSTTKEILRSINEIVISEMKNHPSKHIRGIIKNRLFEYCNE